MEYWDLVENPTGEIYEKFIKLLCSHSDKFYFVTRKELDYDKDIIAKFSPYVLNQYKTKEWASTKISGPAATIYEIEVNEKTCLLLQRLANSLYDWLSPRLPEDLTFIKNNFVWFYSCSHEEFAHFCIRSSHYRDLITGFKEINIERLSD